MEERTNPNKSPTDNGVFATPNVQGGESKTVKPEDLIVFTAYDDSLTSRFHIERLFSLRKRKFIKPFRDPKGAFEYRILPGTYVLITSSVHKRNDEVMEWYVSVVKIYKNQEGKTEVQTIKQVKWVTPIYREDRSIPILRDIQNPPFHGHSSVSYDTVYTEEEVNKLLEGGVDPALSEDFVDQ